MYNSLAAYYDKFMQDVPYGAWISYVENFLKGRKRGMDVGCGTGAFTVALKKAGYDVSGCDVSPEMLTEAAARIRREGLSVPLYLQSADKIEATKPLDFILACCDVVNYLKKPSVFFAKAYSALKSGGVLIFDISTEYKLKEILGNNTFTDTSDGVTYIWENSLDPKNRCVDMRLTFFERGVNNLYSKSVDEQTQYIHTADGITATLAAAGFADVKTYGFLKKSAPKADEQRIHFVAYKQE